MLRSGRTVQAPTAGTLRRDMVVAAIVDGLAAILSWLQLIAAASIFGGGLGWAGLGAVLPPFALAALCARRWRVDLRCVAALAFPCVVLAWPILFVVTLFIVGPGSD
jgi:hypothetical protein